MTPLADDPKAVEAVADRDWWQAMLPPGWKLHGWTDRYYATVYSPDRKRVFQVDGELLFAFTAIQPILDQAVRDERERCALVARDGCLVPPDGGSPTEAEIELCDEIARRIRALGDKT